MKGQIWPESDLTLGFWLYVKCLVQKQGVSEKQTFFKIE